MRRVISLLFSVAVCGIGIWLFYYLYFHATQIRGIVVIGGGTMIIIGALSAIDDIVHLLQTDQKME